jgi:NmrA-like family
MAATVDDKKLAVILGATRGQGLSVIHALLRSGHYRIRGVSRSLHTLACDELAQLGVEMVAADLDERASLGAAFASAHAIFAVTTMCDGDMELEVRQGRNVADAAAAEEMLEHFVWSTLPSARGVSGGRVPVPHMDGKAAVDEYIIASLPGLARKTTFYWGGFYAENVLYPCFVPNFLGSAGRYVWVQAVEEGTVVPMVGDHTVNTGVFVERVLARPDVCLPGGYVLGVVDWMANGELLRMWARVLGDRDGHSVEAVYVKSDVSTVAQLWPGVGKELGGMLKLLEELGKEAWMKEGVKAVTMQDLGLKVGERAGDLVSVEKAIRRLGSGH